MIICISEIGLARRSRFLYLSNDTTMMTSANIHVLTPETAAAAPWRFGDNSTLAARCAR